MNIEILNNRIVVKLDQTIISKEVIAKVCYWLTKDYAILLEVIDNYTNITFTPINSCDDLGSHLNKIQTMILDYNLRAIIEDETKTIRELIIAKAFYPIEDS